MFKFFLGFASALFLIGIYLSTLEIPELIIEYKCGEVNSENFPPLRPKNYI